MDSPIKRPQSVPSKRKARAGYHNIQVSPLSPYPEQWQPHIFPSPIAAVPASAASTSHPNPAPFPQLPPDENTVHQPLSSHPPPPIQPANKSTHPGPLPTFHETPSSDLNSLLATFRSNIFLPSHLIHLQKTLLYRTKNHPLLTADEPATVKLGNEVHQLHPLDRTKDEPATRASIARVTQLMGETRDWRNLPEWLEGLRIAGRKVRGMQLEKMVRRAGEGGRGGVVMDCLRRVEGTGMGLWDLRVAREVFWCAVGRCVQGGWGKEEVERAGRWVEGVWELCADPRHTEKMTRESDPKRRAEVVGVMVLVHAARVVLHGEKEAADAVGKYAEMMLGLWDSKEVGFEEGDWNDANYKMLMWAPVWRGMALARNVVGETSPLGKQLGIKLSEELEPLMQSGQAVLSAHPPAEGRRRGLKMCEDLSQVTV
ncbi:hypothetical protein ACLMJK_001433 [Lecanora helva]